MNRRAKDAMRLIMVLVVMVGMVGAPNGSGGQVPLQLMNPHLAFIESADALQIPLAVVLDLGLPDLSGKLNGFGFVPSDQSSELIQHLKRSLWAAEWRTVASDAPILHHGQPWCAVVANLNKA